MEAISALDLSSAIGMTGLEPAASRSQIAHSLQTELHPEILD